ncbi:glutaredoxin family protein [Macrococcus lamae]|uniref:Glutaredoxin family protein n=1 Tax=Macrococcus lamae TaxID=198484 RepID=A0A4R6BVL2_9STAP|nr:glutaredoxin family protein [Macrococcus lamae]
MTITLYTQNQCPLCEFIKNYFTEKGLVFTEKNISQNKYRHEMIAFDAFSTPLIIINNQVIHTVDIPIIEKIIQEQQHD